MGVGAVLARIGGALEARLEREAEQAPLFLPVALLAGIGAWFVLPDASSWIAFMAVMGAIVLIALGFLRGMRIGALLGWGALFALIGCALIWVRAESVAAPRLERQRSAQLTGTIVRADRLAAREQLRLLIAPDADAGLPPQVRVSVPLEQAVPELEPGARVRLRAFLLPPPPMAVPGAYDFAQRAWFDRIGATGRALGPVEIVGPPDRSGWSEWLAGLRRDLSAHIQAQLEGSSGAIASALATGDQGAIVEEDAEAMRNSGLAHLLSISGLHVTAVVGATMLLALRLLALSPWLALRVNLIILSAAAGALVAIAYTLLTGSEVPTVRSCIAALLVLAGVVLGREAITLRLVATGALLVLLLWPEVAAGPSFQLSFAAIVAIVALHEHPKVQAFLARREEGWPKRLGRGLLGLLLTGLVVEFAIAPISLFHFHQAGLYGALANIIAIPLTTFVTMPAEALALLFDLIGLGAPFWWIAGRSLDLLLWLAHTTSALPGALALVAAPPAWAYALLVAGLLWIALWRTGWRWWGGAPFAVGAAVMLFAPAPDLLVTGDGRHAALRSSDGPLLLLRPRAGDYVRDLLAELSGAQPGFVDWGGAPGTTCSDALCLARIDRGGRQWTILATVSSDRVVWEDMRRACAEADIVISDRRLPRGCTPRWLKADRAFLEEHGGLAIFLGGEPRVRTVAGIVGEHPWAE